jgi:6,7-dimethyl-8-ribityllumazine synthase
MVPTDGYGVASLWLVAEDTGVRHLAAQLRYTSYQSNGYARGTTDDAIDLRLVPGVYDVLFDRDVTTSTTGSGDRWASSTLSTTPIPSGWRTLRTGVVIGPGTNALAIDVPTAHVTGSITLAGATPPAMLPTDGYGVASLWLVAHDTGARHLAGQLRYTSYQSNGYARGTTDDHIDLTLVPGTYDLIYDRDVTTATNASGERWASSTLSTTGIPSGYRTLRTGIVIPAGTSTLMLDIPNATITGSITLDGAAPPIMMPTDGYGVATVWAIATDTLARHMVGQLRYTSYQSNGYARGATDDHIDIDLVPGTYDLLFDRDVTTSSSGSADRWASSTLSSTPIPSAWRVLRRGVVVPAGASVLNVDVPSASVTGHVTLDGATPPIMMPTDGYGVASVWAVATDTGARHLLAQLRYTSYQSNGYARGTTDDAIDVRLVPGTYDILFDRDVTTANDASGERWTSSTLSTTPIPSAWRTIRTGVVIPAGASTLNVDVPSSSVTGSITLDGAVPPIMMPTDGYGIATIWAVATDTHARHMLGQLRYTSYQSNGYARGTTDDHIDVRIVPGTYDILFDRDVTTSSTGSADRWVSSTLGETPIPSGWRLLRSGVVVPSGASSLTIDVPSRALAGNITIDRTTPPIQVPTDGYGVASLWAIARDTGARHLLGQLRYTSYQSNGYDRGALDDLVDVRMVPGTYDILFDRDTTTASNASGDRWVSSTLGETPIPSGWRILRTCVQVQ